MELSPLPFGFVRSSPLVWCSMVQKSLGLHCLSASSVLHPRICEYFPHVKALSPLPFGFVRSSPMCDATATRTLVLSPLPFGFVRSSPLMHLMLLRVVPHVSIAFRLRPFFTVRPSFPRTRPSPRRLHCLSASSVLHHPTRDLMSLARREVSIAFRLRPFFTLQ